MSENESRKFDDSKVCDLNQRHEQHDEYINGKLYVSDRGQRREDRQEPQISKKPYVKQFGERGIYEEEKYEAAGHDGHNHECGQKKQAPINWNE